MEAKLDGLLIWVIMKEAYRLRPTAQNAMA